MMPSVVQIIWIGAVGLCVLGILWSTVRPIFAGDIPRALLAFVVTVVASVVWLVIIRAFLEMIGVMFDILHELRRMNRREENRVAVAPLPVTAGATRDRVIETAFE